MKHILYIGNNLQSKTTNVSSIQVLGSLLQEEGYVMFFASHRVNKVLRLMDMIFKLLKYRNKADYVIIDTYSTHNFYFALIISQLCRFFKLKYIPSLNGGNLPARLKRDPKMCHAIFDHAYVNISPSKYLKDAFEDYGFENIIHIPNTFKIENYPLRKKTYDTIRMLWVRSFARIYNPQLAVKVLRVLKDRGYKASLCMVGPVSDGSFQDVKELANELHVDVTFTGKLKKKDWIALSNDYNIFINTTNFDNMPLSVVEAMALGLPIVSTNVGGMPYLIADGYDGILVLPNNEKLMADAIVSVFNDAKLRDQIIDNARKKVETYDWNTVRQHWLNILR